MAQQMGDEEAKILRKEEEFYVRLERNSLNQILLKQASSSRANSEEKAIE